MTDKLIEETIILPKKDRFTETINASLEEICKLYKVVLLYNLSVHFEKKIFKGDKEKGFQKELHELHQKTIKSVKCEYTSSTMNQGGIGKAYKEDYAVYTIDGIPITLKTLLRSKGTRFSEFDDVNKEVRDLCKKHDGHGVPTFTPVYEKHVEAYWHSYADH
jgi:hypothetical protein